MLRRARFALRLAMVLASAACAACQALLASTSETDSKSVDSGAGDSGSVGGEGGNDAAAMGDASSDRDAADAIPRRPLDCDGAAFCADFEKSKAYMDYGLVLRVGGPTDIAFVPCLSPSSQCLEVHLASEPALLASVPIRAPDATVLDWDLDLECLDAAHENPPNYSYVAHLQIGAGHVLLACAITDGPVRVHGAVLAGDGGESQSGDFAASGDHVHARVNLETRTAEFFAGDASTPGYSADLSTDTPTTATLVSVGFGSPYGAFWRVRFDDVRVRVQ